jgi:hypothetical protein
MSIIPAALQVEIEGSGKKLERSHLNKKTLGCACHLSYETGMSRITVWARPGKNARSYLKND